MVIRRKRASKSDLVKGCVGRTVVGVVAPLDRSGEAEEFVIDELKEEDSDLETESFLWDLDRKMFFGLILAVSFMVFGNDKNSEYYYYLVREIAVV